MTPFREPRLNHLLSIHAEVVPVLNHVTNDAGDVGDPIRVALVMTPTATDELPAPPMVDDPRDDPDTPVLTMMNKQPT